LKNRDTYKTGIYTLLDPGKDAGKGNRIRIQQDDDTLRQLEENSDGVVRSDADVRVPGDGAGGAGPGY
jgi:hypothetical protein